MNNNLIPEDFINGELQFQNDQLRHVIRSMRDTMDVKDKCIDRLQLDIDILNIQLQFYEEQYKTLRDLIHTR